MKQLLILFDLDGTLTDSGEGILKCAALALRHFGLPVPEEQVMRRFVGPPLRETFPKFGVPGDRVEEALSVFRGRYHSVGKFENKPYPGIRTLLEQLSADGHRLYVATSKPEPTAREILDKFQLAEFFTEICGADMEGRRDTKEAVLAELLPRLPSEGRKIMVGDTIFDIEGAKRHGIPTVAVTWGYGDPAELTEAAARASDPAELYRILTDLAKP